MTESVLLNGKFPDTLARELAREYRVVQRGSESPGEMAAVRAVVTHGHAAVDRALIGSLSALELICCYGSGYDGVDLAAAAERGIVVAYSPGANAASVADLAMGLVIASVRRILPADRFVRDGRWRTGKMEATRGLDQLKLGIYGLGAIGTKLATRAAAFDMEVAYHGRRPHGGVAYPFHPDLRSLAEWADVLAVCVRANDENRGSIDAAVLRALGAGGYVVNVARGSVIDQEALVAALRDRTIAGAALDVLDGEPAVPEPLLGMNQVILTPHIGGGALSAHEVRQRLLLSNLRGFFAGELPPDRV